jgi:hypothetical protein
MELDVIYKTKVGESHEAGLRAVYEAGQEAVFVSPPPDITPVIAVVAVAAPVPDAGPQLPHRGSW